jgi:hypothetical protein
MLRAFTGPARTRLHYWTGHFEQLIRSGQADTAGKLDEVLDRLDRLEQDLARARREVELGQERQSDQYAFLAARLSELATALGDTHPTRPGPPPPD